jgi:uncharacterized protein (DUF2235 family)
MHRAVGDRPDNIWTGTLFDVSEQLDQAAQEKNRNGAGRWLNCRTAQGCGAGTALNSSTSDIKWLPPNVRLRGNSGHDELTAPCLLLTHSGHHPISISYRCSPICYAWLASSLGLRVGWSYAPAKFHKSCCWLSSHRTVSAASMPRNILIFSDGTGQAGGLTPDERISNIYKLYRATRVGPESSINPAEQLAYYDAGLGSRPPSGGVVQTLFRMAYNFLSQATGFGLTTNIMDCYEMLIQLWRPGDRIFLFGFSRGAYTVRCLAGVLANCGIPTRLENGAAMKYDEGTARRLAKIAIKRVHQHAASVPRSKAMPRENELMDQRLVLARTFCETYASRQQDGSEYPYFIGVFDTVAAIAGRGSLLVLTISTLFMAAIISHVSGALAGVAALIHFSSERWWPWFVVMLVAIFLIVFVWYVTNQVKFAPEANSKRPWRTLTIWFGRMAFEDKTLDNNVRYARHAISIDENRAAFARVGWGDPDSSRPEKDPDGFCTFEQFWFAGNHSDVGGSYAENESRLSDISLSWMVEAATTVRDGIRIDSSVLRLYPSGEGMQHDERKVGFPLLTAWLRLTWHERRRDVRDPNAPLHDSVYERFALPGVLQYDVVKPYRPEGLRQHAHLADYYKDILVPPVETGPRGNIKSFFLNS